MKKSNKGNGAVALIVIVGALVFAVILAVGILSLDRAEAPVTPTSTPEQLPSSTLEEVPLVVTNTPKPTSTPKPVVKPATSKPTSTGEIDKKPVEETPVINYPAVTGNMIKVLDLTNQARAEEGLPPLALNPQLSQSAQAKANYIAETGDFAHTSKDGKTGGDYMIEAGYRYSDRGENLARGFATVEDSFAGWMASPTHKRNILWANFQEIGIGFNGNIIVQHFGLKLR